MKPLSITALKDHSQSSTALSVDLLSVYHHFKDQSQTSTALSVDLLSVYHRSQRSIPVQHRFQRGFALSIPAPKDQSQSSTALSVDLLFLASFLASLRVGKLEE